MENVKNCTKCGADKPLSEFGPTKQQLKFGVKSWCRECEKAYKAEWVTRNPSRIRQLQSGWKATNREKVREWNREYQKRIRKEQPERSAMWERRARLKREYGVTPEWFEQKVAEQNGLCAICSAPPDAKGLNIDHCHKTGKAADLLCTACNTSLFRLETHMGWVAKAEAYLRKHGRWPDEDAPASPDCAHEKVWVEPI